MHGAIKFQRSIDVSVALGNVLRFVSDVAVL